MKRFIAEMAVCMLLLLGCSCAAAEDVFPGITVKGHRLSGTVTARFGTGSGAEREVPVLVDCPIPQEAYTGDVFEMAYRSISKEDVQKALRAVGQSDQGRFVHARGAVHYTCTERVDPTAESTREEAADQAVQIGLAFFDALGVEVVRTPAHIERPYDEEAYMQDVQERLSHQYSEVAELMEQHRAQWKRRQKYETREAQYTRVEFDVMADGMRIWGQPSYPAGDGDETDAWKSFSTGAWVLVSDSGIIVEAAADHVPDVRKRRVPEDGELERFAQALYDQRGSQLVWAESWQDALALVLADASRIGCVTADAQDGVYQNSYMAGPVTAYGSRSVITEIYPCLSAISEDEWAMFWQIGSQLQYDDGYRY